MPGGHLMRPGEPLRSPRWLENLLWRLRRWNQRQNCESHHRHEMVDNEVHNRRIGTLVRVRWCRHCSHIEWVD